MESEFIVCGSAAMSFPRKIVRCLRRQNLSLGVIRIRVTHFEEKNVEPELLNDPQLISVQLPYLSVEIIVA
jgi:hypothetical protein